MASTLPTCSNLSLDTNFNLPKCVIDKNSVNPLGLNHYSYFENLNLNTEDKEKMSSFVDTNALIIMAWKEENAAFWLTELYKLTTDPVKRLFFLKEAYEEQEHFSLLVGIINQLFDSETLNKEFLFFKNNYNNVRKFEYQNEKLSSSLFEYTIKEIEVLVYIDQIKQNTTLEPLKEVLKSIVSDEIEHLQYGTIFIEEEKIERYKPMYKDTLYASFRALFSKFYPSFLLHYIKQYCQQFNLDYNNVVKNIKDSNRNKDFILTMVLMYYKYGQLFGIVDSDFETTLKNAGVLDQYYKLKNE